MIYRLSIVLNKDSGHLESSSDGSPSNQRTSKAGLQTIDELEREHVIRALELTGGNRKRAAELLGINRRTLYRMAERFGIELDAASGD